MLSLHRLALLLLAATIAPLAIAFASQYWGGLLPCELCIWQRWGYGAAIALSLIAVILPDGLRRAGIVVAALAILGEAGIALFHTGVEQHWWKGLAACSGNLSTAGQSLSDLENQLMATPIIPCDRPAWTMFGVSMAGYNFAYALALGLFGLFAASRAKGRA
jgi:disulfide bond formation protein DsbB